MTGPGYLQPELAIAVDVFKHIFTLQVCDAVNFPFRLLEKVDTSSYMLPGQKAEPIESGYLATVLARYDTSISSDWSDQRTEAIICWLKREDMCNQPGRYGSAWSNYLFWLIYMIATAAPLGVAIWQDDWWMRLFGALLVLDAMLRTAYASKADMTYNIDLPRENTGQNEGSPKAEGSKAQKNLEEITSRYKNKGKAKEVPEDSKENKTTVARYGHGMCIISGSTDVVKSACRSRIVGNIVPRFLAIAYAVSSVLQLLANLIAVPNGGAYAQMAYLGTISVCFLIQIFCHRFRTRVGPDQHAVICPVLATKVEAVTYMAFQILDEECNVFQGLGLINADEYNPLPDEMDNKRATEDNAPATKINIKTDTGSTSKGGDKYNKCWEVLQIYLKQGKKDSHLPQLPRSSKKKVWDKDNWSDNWISLDRGVLRARDQRRLPSKVAVKFLSIPVDIDT